MRVYKVHSSFLKKSMGRGITYIPLKCQQTLNLLRDMICANQLLIEKVKLCF